MKNTVRNDATSSNLKGKPMTKKIGLHWLQQFTKHVPATDEASVHRAQLRVKSLYSLPVPPAHAQRVFFFNCMHYMILMSEKMTSQKKLGEIKFGAITNPFSLVVAKIKK
jgi:hypothetical protein